MMNEVLLLFSSFVCISFILTAWGLGKERIYTTIVILLLLILLVGGRIITVAGHETNAGNIFYASIYLATYFIIERFGKREAMRSIRIGVVCVLFFSILLWTAITYQGSGATPELDASFPVAFQTILQTMMASLIAYSISQTLNIHIYCYLRSRYEDVHIWLRANFSNICAQIVDSGIFFIIAFWNTVPFSNFKDIILTGLALKILFMAVTSPLLSMNRLEEDETGFAMIKPR